MREEIAGPQRLFSTFACILDDAHHVNARRNSCFADVDPDCVLFLLPIPRNTGGDLLVTPHILIVQ